MILLRCRDADLSKVPLHLFYFFQNAYSRDFSDKATFPIVGLLKNPTSKIVSCTCEDENILFQTSVLSQYVRSMKYTRKMATKIFL